MNNPKIVQVTPTNDDPTVDAGPDQTVDCDGPPCLVQLDGTVNDPDNFPRPLVIEWTVEDGPGTVIFDDDASASTTARFTTPGVYVLSLTAHDGWASASDQVQITVNGDDTGILCRPVAYWNLDEGSGPTAHDVSGHGHDGTLQGSPQWVSGYHGQALAFDGDDYVEIGDEAPFDLTEALTVAAWANIERIASDWTAVITKGNSAWRLSTVLSENRFHFAVTGPDAGPNWINGETRVGLGEWHHVTGTYDGSAIRLYVDGVEDPAGPVAYSGPISTNDYPVRLADNAQVPGWSLIGRIDDVRIYECVLNAGQIQELMADPSWDLDGPAGTMHIREVIDNGPVPDQPACYASLESGSGTTVEYDTTVLNIWDNGLGGHFDDDGVFGVVQAGHRSRSEVDDLSLRAAGIVRIPAGQGGPWTFGVNSDDGFTLQFPGCDFLSTIDGELMPSDEGDALRFLGGRAAGDTFGTINLPSGDHLFWLTYHENWADASLELFAAPGSHTTFDPEAFYLVGHRFDGRVAVPGLCEKVTMEASRPGAWSSGAIDSLADARAALSQGTSNGTNTSATYPFVNHADPDGGGASLGFFPDDVRFPNDRPGTDDDDFAVTVTGLLDIPADGTYQIGFNSDDGASLIIHGRAWDSIVADAANNAVIDGDELKSDSLTAWSFTAGQITLPAGCYAFEAVMLERINGAFFELLGRGVSDRGVADPSWHLLKVGGARILSVAEGLQLVPME